MSHMETITKKGFVLIKSEAGSNEFRTWNIHYFSHPKGYTLMFDDSKLLVIVRDISRHVIHEGKVNLNFVNETF